MSEQWRRRAQTLSIAVCLAWPYAAGAVLEGDAQIRLREDEGGPLDVTDLVTIGAGPEITPGDGSAIGALLLPSESIDLGGAAIELVVEEGASDGSAGYPPNARFEFGGLDFGDPDLGIVGVTLALDNTTLDAADVSFTRDSVTVYVDALGIGEIPAAVDVGSVTLLLDIADVPEPAVGLASAAALAALTGLRHRSRARATKKTTSSRTRSGRPR